MGSAELTSIARAVYFLGEFVDSIEDHAAFDRFCNGRAIDLPDQPIEDGDEVDSDIEGARTEPLRDDLRTEAATSSCQTCDLEPVEGQDYVDNGRGATGVARGFLIEADRLPAVLHCPDETKLYVESIAQGKYNIQWFPGQFRIPGQRTDFPFRWEDGNHSTTDRREVEFDWHDPAHILKLNRWRRNVLIQITGEAIREKVGAKLNKYEEDWLREQEAMRTEEKYFEMAGHDLNDIDQVDFADDFFNNGDNFPLKMSTAELEALTNLFNTTFADKSFYEKVVFRCPPGTMGPVRVDRIRKDMSKIGPVPRPSRTAMLLGQHRRRMVNYSKHFMLSYEYKGRYGVDHERDLVEVPDSDFEDSNEEAEEAGSNDGDESDVEELDDNAS